MLIKKASDIRSSEITPKDVYMRRREFLKTGGAAFAGVAAAGLAGNLILPESAEAQQAPKPGRKLNFEQGGMYDTDEKMTPWKDITTYNNYYEFGTGKDDPAKTSGDFKTDPWSIKVDGECNKPGTFGLEDFIKGFTLEERIYRLRCVEAWSMVVPWVGIPMGEVLKKFEPNGNAKFVRFTTLEDPKRMWGQQRRVLDWPYVDGLRMDEAMNPLAIFVLGVYGVVLPNQNGAPIRMMAPWKYGFKNTKAIVRVTFLKEQFRNTWNITAPNEYGFYANVNPSVPHPRWSQATELRLGSGFLGRRIKTLMFNGYADQVQHLYAGMDLKKNY